jgi:hypothetical protein
MGEYLELMIDFTFWFLIGMGAWLIIEKIFGGK